MNKQYHGHTLVESFAVEAREVYDPFSDEEPLECDVDEAETCDACN